MQAWREDTKAGARLQRKQRAFAGTFEADARAYLRAVTALPTYTERVREIEGWIAIFKTQRRESITPGQIRAIRDGWLTQPRSPTDPRPLAAGTVNKRLRALSNLFAVLDGERLPNPVRRVPEAREPDQEPRALDYATIRAILAALPDVARTQRGKPRGTVSRTKIRLRCLAFCPLTPRQLGQVAPGDLDLEHARVRVTARKKGRGARAIWMPLVPEAVDAFRDFHAHDCYGAFSVSALRKSFKAGISRAGLTLRARVYDLRHSFATMAFRATHSLEAVASLLQHTNTRTSARYAEAATTQVLAERGAAVGRLIGATSSTEASQSATKSHAPRAPLQTIRPRAGRKDDRKP